MSFNPEWILNPLTINAIRGTGLLALMFLWFGARVEASKCRHEMLAMKKGTDVVLRELASKVDQIAVDKIAVDKIAARPATEPVQHVPVITQSLNLTRRAKALHMHRRGDASHTIAAALDVSRGEVELLFKLDQIIQQPRD